MKYVILLLCVLTAGSTLADPPRRTTVNLSIFFTLDPKSNFKTLIIPIKRVKNLIVIEARIDTIVGNFVLDTGSPELVLNNTYFRTGWESNGMAANATGGFTLPIIRTNVNNLSIKDLYFENIEADLNDLGHIENLRGIKILGLLGVSLFTSFEMVIDQYKSVMYLHRLDNNGNVPDEERIVKSRPVLKVPFNLKNNIITIPVTVNNTRLIYCLDTGAEMNALSNLLPARILEHFRVEERMVMLGAGGSSAEVLLGTLDEFSLGVKTFKNMRHAITRLDDLGEAYGTAIDGILGNNFLVKGIISINFVTKELCMYPFDVSKP